MAKKQTFFLTAKAVRGSEIRELFGFASPYQIDRMAEHLKGLNGKRIRVEIAASSRPKTEEALGMYFGAIVPATAMDRLGLSYKSETIYQDYVYWKNEKKISQIHLDAVDDSFRVEYHFRYTRTLKGKPYRIPKELSTQDNAALLELIDKCMAWRAENGYPDIDIESYKTKRESAELK